MKSALELKPVVYVARTLLPDSDTFAAVRVINISDGEYVTERGWP